MPIHPRKSSHQVTLVLLGAAALVGCSQEDPALVRDVYTSREDCAKDWGDEVKCEQAPVTSHNGFHGAYWYGPSYRGGQFGLRSGDSAPGTVDAARPGSHAVFTGHVGRGGFGATGSAHGFGGG